MENTILKETKQDSKIGVLDFTPTLTDHYLMTSLSIIYEHSLKNVVKEEEDPPYSLTAIFFERFPLPFELNGSIPHSQLLDFLEKLKTHKFILNDFVKEDYYIPPPCREPTVPLRPLPFVKREEKPVGETVEETVENPVEETVEKGRGRMGTVVPYNKLIRDGLVTKDAKPFINQVVSFISLKFGEEYVKEGGVNDTTTLAGGIFPLNISRFPTPEDDPLYKLIWETSIQSCMKPAYFHRYNLRISTHLSNMDFVYSLDIPIFKGWTKLSLILKKTGKRNVLGYHYLTESDSSGLASKLLYLQCNRGRPVYCKQIKAAVWENLNRMGLKTETETGLVTKLKERGITLDEMNRAGFFQIHTKLGLMKYIDYGAVTGAVSGAADEGYILSFIDGGTIQLFKETEISKPQNNILILQPSGIVCGKHFYHLPEIGRVWGGGLAGKVTASISPELNDYINKLIENEGLGQTKYSIGKYKETELKIGLDKDGGYLEWGEEPYIQRKTLAALNIPIECLDETRAIEFIEKEMKILENVADHKRIFRVLDPYTSIRHSKYGTYIYHKTETMKKTKFISLKKCPFDYMKASPEEIMKWCREPPVPLRPLPFVKRIEKLMK